jgi:signal transduction histidine kinase
VTKLQALLHSEKGKLEAVIDSITDWIITVDLNHQLLVANPAVKEILEISNLKQDQALTMFDIVDALAGKTDLRTKIDQALVENKPVLIPDVVLKNKALEITITPVKNDQGEKIGANVVFHDITTEKSLDKLRQEFTAFLDSHGAHTR